MKRARFEAIACPGFLPVAALTALAAWRGMPG
jgi:hypothetical protein